MALQEQVNTLWHTTNIYRHPKIYEYVEQLASKFPGDLKVGICSKSFVVIPRCPPEEPSLGSAYVMCVQQNDNESTINTIDARSWIAQSECAAILIRNSYNTLAFSTLCLPTYWQVRIRLARSLLTLFLYKNSWKNIFIYLFKPTFSIYFLKVVPLLYSNVLLTDGIM